MHVGQDVGCRERAERNKEARQWDQHEVLQEGRARRQGKYEKMWLGCSPPGNRIACTAEATSRYEPLAPSRPCRRRRPSADRPRPAASSGALSKRFSPPPGGSTSLLVLPLPPFGVICEQAVAGGVLGCSPLAQPGRRAGGGAAAWDSKQSEE